MENILPSDNFIFDNCVHPVKISQILDISKSLDTSISFKFTSFKKFCVPKCFTPGMEIDVKLLQYKKVKSLKYVTVGGSSTL